MDGDPPVVTGSSSPRRRAWVIKLIVYPVRDLARAKTFYRALLGVDPYVDSPFYVGYRVGEQEIEDLLKIIAATKKDIVEQK